jgi:hypothetical protein
MHRRRSLRYLRRTPWPLRLLLFATLAVTVLGVMFLVGSVLLLVVLAGATIGAAMVLVRLARFARRVRRAWTSGGLAVAARPAPVDGPAEWRKARRRFEALRAEYASYECDPLAVLRLPALADVSVPATARFVDAFAEAQALHSEAEPPAEFAGAYRRAVDRAWRSWGAARDAAERIRLSGLTLEERNSVQRVIKLLTMARDSGHDAERLAAYGKARAELAKLERAGRLQVPRPALAALDEAARASLPPSASPAHTATSVFQAARRSAAQAT